SGVEEGVRQIPEAAGHAARTPPSRTYHGHECKVVFDQMCCACHGFSLLVTGRRGEDRHSMLFDVGPYADIWLDNARRLGVDLSTIEHVFLSHWHFDHSGGFPQVVAAIARARTAAGLARPIVDLHPDRPDQRGILSPSGAMLLLPQEPTFDDIAQAGGEIVKRGDPHAICGGFFFGSGAIDRVTAYETGLAGHHSFRGGDGEPDPLIMDERFVAACVPGRGVTVLSACSHAGIVNACLGAKKHFSHTPIDVVIGGYHLSCKAMETRIMPTGGDLQTRIHPPLAGPCHRTGR